MPFENKFGFMASLGFAEWPAPKVVQAIASTGYGAVEWTLAHFNPKRKSISDLRELVRVTETAGLAVSAVAVQQDLLTVDDSLRGERASLINGCILAAAEVGISILNVFSGPATWNADSCHIPEDLTEGQAWDLLAFAYEPLVKAAERYGVTLALEPGFNMLCHDYYSTQELFRRLDSPRLGINLDPSHLVLYRNDVPWVIRQWFDRIKHVHLKDAIGRAGQPGQDFMFPLLGEGLVPWSDFFKSLVDVGYDGFLSVEFESFDYYSHVLRSDPVEAAQLSMSQIGRLLVSSAEPSYDHHNARRGF